jgi:FkbM family methyltransferase
VTIVRHSYEHALRKHFVLDRGVFLDIGAHIGKYTVTVARRLDGAGRVIAVEPDPDNFRSLRKNVEANGLRNVTLFNVACAAVDGEAILYRDPCEPIKHSLRKGPGAGIAVQSRSIDSLMASLGIDEVDLMKLDVEGSEAAVLEGSRETLRRSPQVRVILEAEGPPPWIDAMRDLGFVISQTAHRFGKNGRYYVAQRRRSARDEHAPPVDLGDILTAR